MDNLLKNIHTVEDLDLIIHNLTILQSHIFQNKVVNLDLIDNFLTKENALEFAKDLENSKINVQDPDELSLFISKIIERLFNMPRVSIIFAFVPTRSLLKKVMEQVDGNGRFVFDYTIDTGIYGGILILKDGIVHDYSIQKIVSGFF